MTTAVPLAGGASTFGGGAGFFFSGTGFSGTLKIHRYKCLDKYLIHEALSAEDVKPYCNKEIFNVSRRIENNMRFIDLKDGLSYQV